MDCIVHGVAMSRTRLRDFHFHKQKKLAGIKDPNDGEVMERERDKRQSLQLPKRKKQPGLLTPSSSLHGPVKLYFLI